ncbi:MAG: biotin/lipoyl-binding protein, partial [Clostridia bacterium]|nr:biotin/lipoyl-binding protein [Clostridia bacterium]
MKKFAIRGLVTVAVFVALCMFFSGTIKTITTAKVRLVSAKTGKLEEEIDLKGKLVFPETEEIYLAGLEDDQQVVITRVRVTQGRQVKQGDVLFEAEVSGYESALEQLEAEYTAAQSEMMELERKNGDVRLKRTEENWIAAYDALAQAKSVVREKQTALTVAAKLAGVVLEGGALPEEEKDEALLSAQQAVADAKAAESAAKTAFDSANRLGISEEIVDYVTKSRELTEKMESAQQEIAALTVLAQQAAAVTAPHDGYVVEVNVKAGDSY